MQYWLMKTEPETFGWADLVKDGKATWDGVRNYMARNNLAAMKRGDRVMIYHSVTGKEVVGIAEVTREAFPDPTLEGNHKWLAVEVKPLEKLKRAVSLAEIKENKKLGQMQLVRNSRLSVMPVSASEWKTILELSQKN